MLRDSDLLLEMYGICAFAAPAYFSKRRLSMISVGSNGNVIASFPGDIRESIRARFSAGSLAVATPFARPYKRRSSSLKKPSVPFPGRPIICWVNDGRHFVWSRNADSACRPPVYSISLIGLVLFILGPIKSQSLIAKSSYFGRGGVRV